MSVSLIQQRHSGGVARLERRVSSRKVAGSMSVMGITLLYPWERHLTLIFEQALCVVWKTAQVSVSQRHIPEKK